MLHQMRYSVKIVLHFHLFLPKQRTPFLAVLRASHSTAQHGAAAAKHGWLVVLGTIYVQQPATFSSCCSMLCLPAASCCKAMARQ